MQDSTENWTPRLWQQKTTRQQPEYADQAELARVCKELGRLPPLVTAAEIESLKQQLAEAAAGKRFILQGGDCAESFAECNDEKITNKLKILLQMSLVLVQDLKLPITRIGRMAGQYAKPRSTAFETRQGETLPCYRGDLINEIDFTQKSRAADPAKMLQGYGLASLTLNYIRALMDSGFADLHRPEQWQMSYLKSSTGPGIQKYQDKVAHIQNSIELMESISGESTQNIDRIEFFTCHEALLLHYESALTRKINGKWYNLSTHYPWIGMRTAYVDSGHIEYMRGIANPIALKVGANMHASELERLIKTLDPDNEPGRLSLIHRFGVKNIKQNLPLLIKKLKSMHYQPLWICDPMHGNTQQTSQGHKTRHFKDIILELEYAFQLHQQLDSRLGGVHLELTGDPVTECLGGASNLQEIDLHRDYRSAVDPRLNAEQALEVALEIGNMFSYDASNRKRYSNK